MEVSHCSSSSNDGWDHWSFRGSQWTKIRKSERKRYLKNAYRVLLTRARQGMIIVVPTGNDEDHTRSPGFYNPTYEYLKNVGFPVIV
ncbi:MAG: DNA/RNA helicase domain-containing protein [Candidatus Marinimicrobia bacterium]|nr:DNA/RNA helicase domain-containing protein [Candidatus Neomarinimicrobiota bacterium]